MNENILNGIAKKTGVSDLSELLADKLSGSELSSLLLAVYERKTRKMKPAELLAQYRQNRLVQPSSLDKIALMENELMTLRFFRNRGFFPVELSPVAALGTCSVVAAVSQDKIISGVRNTEIVADATNCIAMHVADVRKRGEEGVLRFCTTHRHVRTQPFANPRFLPHFVIGCMVTAGRDVGSYGFECEGVVEQVGNLVALLRDEYGVGGFRLVLKRRGGYEGVLVDRVEAALREGVNGVRVEREGAGGVGVGEGYYLGVQFKLYIDHNGGEWEIADGGFVDWTQKLVGNRKERMLISGFGLELLYKMRLGLL